MWSSFGVKEDLAKTKSKQKQRFWYLQPHGNFNWRLVLIQLTLKLKAGFQHQSGMWPCSSHHQATTGQMRPQVSSLRWARATMSHWQPLTWWGGGQVGSLGRFFYGQLRFESSAWDATSGQMWGIVKNINGGPEIIVQYTPEMQSFYLYSNRKIHQFPVLLVKPFLLSL